MGPYDANFYRYLASFATRSAEHIVPVVAAALQVRSVVDFGCGQGAWLRVWARQGAEILGFDGDYVDRSGLLISASAFKAADLSRPVTVGRTFDLVQSLEVAEHLPRDRAESFVAMLVAHAPCVLFSAAVPGQGGEQHVNERPLEYWRGLFRSHGYLPVDLVRPAVRGDARVQIWYRCNTLLYVREDALNRLSNAARGALVTDGQPLRTEWPIAHRIRQRLLRPLPVRVVDALARLSAERLSRRATRA